MTNLKSAAWLVPVLASVMACYSVSLRAASERTAIVAAEARMRDDVATIRLLRAELRTRSRLPELQRWNAQVLALAPPRAEQLVGDPVLLASYSGRAAPAAKTMPAPVEAVVRDAPPTRAVVERTAYRPPTPDQGARDLAADAAAASTQARVVKVALR